MFFLLLLLINLIHKIEQGTISPELSRSSGEPPDSSSQFQFPPPHRKPLDRPVSKIPQRALHKQAQTSNITNLFNKFITTIRLKGTGFLVQISFGTLATNISLRKTARFAALVSSHGWKISIGRGFEILEAGFLAQFFARLQAILPVTNFRKLMKLLHHQIGFCVYSGLQFCHGMAAHPIMFVQGSFSSVRGYPKSKNVSLRTDFYINRYSKT